MRPMPQKCFWCAKESSDLQAIELSFKGKMNTTKVCNANCEQELRDFAKYADQHKKHYIFLFALSLLVGLILTIWRMKIDFGALGVFVLFAGSGLTLIKYPFVTFQTVSSLGARKAIASGRFLGWLNIGIGLVCWLFLAVFLSE
jgi:uncharacterized membrane protein